MEEGLETTVLQLSTEPALSNASVDFLAGENSPTALLTGLQTCRSACTAASACRLPQP